jgi:hypothetical protein
MRLCGFGCFHTDAELVFPTQLALDTQGNVYVAFPTTHVVRKVTVSTGIISTVAGSGVPGYSGDGGSATAAAMSLPVGVTVDSNGNIYISDSANDLIREVTP